MVLHYPGFITAAALLLLSLAGCAGGIDPLTTGAVPAPSAGAAAFSRTDLAPEIPGFAALPFTNAAQIEQWMRATAEGKRQSLLSADCRGTPLCEAEPVLALRSIASTYRSLPMPDRLRLVNSRVNHILRYREDADAYEVTDYWASFHDVMQSGAGDCEDLAIVKLALLREMGIPASDMHLLVALDNRRQRYHALLVVRVGGQRLYLDSLSDEVTGVAGLAGYTPLYALGGTSMWIYGVS